MKGCAFSRAATLKAGVIKGGGVKGGALKGGEARALGVVWGKTTLRCFGDTDFGRENQTVVTRLDPMPNLRGGRGGRGGLAAPPLLQPPLPLGQLSAAASFLDSVASLAPQQAPPQRPAAARRPPLPQGGGYGGGGYGGQSAPQQAPPPRSAAGRPQPAAATAASPGSDLLAAFSQTRQQLLSGKNSYLDYCQLHNLLQQKQKHRPKEVGEAMHALQRVLPR